MDRANENSFSNSRFNEHMAPDYQFKTKPARLTSSVRVYSTAQPGKQQSATSVAEQCVASSTPDRPASAAEHVCTVQHSRTDKSVQHRPRHSVT